MNYRNKKILKAADGASCQMCGKCDGTIVAAHSNSQRHGKGIGLKAHDLFVAFLCGVCHDWYDGRTSPVAGRADRQTEWQRAHDKTMLRLIETGVIK